MQARCAVLVAAAMLLGAPACTPSAHTARGSPTPRAPLPTGFRREEPPHKHLVSISLDGVAADRYVTVLVRMRDLSPEQRAQVATYVQQRPVGETCDCVASPLDDDTVIITDVRSKLECLLPDLFRPR